MSPSVEVRRTTTVLPARDGRLVPYLVIAFGTLVGALVLGEGALAIIGVPFTLALVLGLRRTGPVAVTARLVLGSDQVLEGDTVSGRLELSWNGPFDALVLLHRLKGVSATSAGGASRWAPGSRSVVLPIRCEAAQWGRHTLGEVWVRLSIPFGLLTWTGKIMAGPPVRVLPGAERLNRLLSPSESRAVWGMHRSRRLGDGHEFAEMRPYVPGDRLRDLNWAASARHGRPFVNRHHPELSGDVVIAIDAFDDGSVGSATALARTARVAWALASLHLRANDRVGLVGLGGSTQWLPPAGGRLAQYRLMETLLRIGGEAADRVASPIRRAEVPPAGLVIVLTSLQDPGAIRVLTRWRARGRAVAAVVIDVVASLDPAASTADGLAYRLWSLELEHRMWQLRRLGIPVVRAPVDGAMSPVITALQRARGGRSMRAAR